MKCQIVGMGELDLKWTTLKLILNKGNGHVAIITQELVQ